MVGIDGGGGNYGTEARNACGWLAEEEHAAAESYGP